MRTLVTINKFFSKRNFKHKLCKINNRHHFITISKCFFFCLFFLLLLCKVNNIKTNSEVLKRQDSKEIFSKDSYLTMQAIGKTETKKILSYYALSKIHLRMHKSFFRFILFLSGDINLNPGPYTDILLFFNSSFSISFSRVFLASNDENQDIKKWKKFKKKGQHFVHIKINSLLPKIAELRHFTETTDTFVIGIIETRLDNSNLSSETEIERYGILRLDRCRRGGGVACYVKKILAYNYKHNVCKNTESIFIDIFLIKTKPI